MNQHRRLVDASAIGSDGDTPRVTAPVAAAPHRVFSGTDADEMLVASLGLGDLADSFEPDLLAFCDRITRIDRRNVLTGEDARRVRVALELREAVEDFDASSSLSSIETFKRRVSEIADRLHPTVDPTERGLAAVTERLAEILVLHGGVA